MKGLLLSADFFSYHEIEHIFAQNKQMFEKDTFIPFYRTYREKEIQNGDF